MLTIVQALKKEHIWLRVEGNKRYMIWLEGDKEWEVIETFSGKKLCQTPDQRTAVDYLLGKR